MVFLHFFQFFKRGRFFYLFIYLFLQINSCLEIEFQYYEPFHSDLDRILRYVDFYYFKEI